MGIQHAPFSANTGHPTANESTYSRWHANCWYQLPKTYGQLGSNKPRLPWTQISTVSIFLCLISGIIAQVVMLLLFIVLCVYPSSDKVIIVLLTAFFSSVLIAASLLWYAWQRWTSLTLTLVRHCVNVWQYRPPNMDISCKTTCLVIWLCMIVDQWLEMW